MIIIIYLHKTNSTN